MDDALDVSPTAPSAVRPVAAERTIFITGGTGFVGSACIQRWLEDGVRVVGVPEIRNARGLPRVTAAT